MSIYQVIRDALDEIYKDLSNCCENPDAEVCTALKELTLSYTAIPNAKVDYSKPAVKYAYLFKYAGIRASAVYSMGRVQRMFGDTDSKSLVVTSFGAGPGSDFLGVLRRSVEGKSELHLRFNFVDLDRTWEETAKILKKATVPYLNLLPQPKARFHALDCSSKDIGVWLDPFEDTDCFTVSYLLSELSSDSAKRFLSALVSIAKRGSTIVVLDNNVDSITALLREFAGNLGLPADKVKMGVIYLDGESVENLGSHFQKFGKYENGGFPNVQINSAWIEVVVR